MLITVTNISDDLVAINTIYKTLQVDEAVTFSRTAAQIDADLQLKSLITDGLVEVTMESETSDASIVPTTPLAHYTNTSRPDATTVSAYTVIYNTSDQAINVSDGTNWRDADGNVT
jgi:hypothetical protein